MDTSCYEANIILKIKTLNFFYILITKHKCEYEDAADIIDRMSELQVEITELRTSMKRCVERNS